MSDDFICPFCNHAIALTNETHRSYTRIFDGEMSHMLPVSSAPFSVYLDFYRCPHCNEESIVVTGAGTKVHGITRWIHPLSTAKQFPDYIPEQIRSDYNEACSIVDLSPKASATLSRRCLQGMIRDFWQVSGKANLYQEIDAISGKVDSATKNALNAVRQIGNIGAHMETDIDKIVDIDPNEAQTLLLLIERLLNAWYVDRHNTDELLAEINSINDAKQDQRSES